ncbi:MAG: hypothetical protein KF884_02625 [Fimbriimonadaceae bacterium]|nr:hypothetical protein [Fimbriimonadaceae bacterium]QYK58990.1 MAG: hypothetical protein KF884_02625 [Fimbriimonadaceae bacterium]
MSQFFGRTNVSLPRAWLALLARGSDAEARDTLVGRALDLGAPLGVSSAPSLWGPSLGRREATLVACGALEVCRALDSKQAFDIVTGELVALLSALGRDHVAFYFLKVRSALEEHQIAGSIEALHAAKEEGLVRFAGLRCDGPGMVGLGLWRLHDAFEAVMVPRSPTVTEPYDTLAPLAQERRVGLVTRSPFRWGPPDPAPERLGMKEVALGWLRSAMEEAPVIVGVSCPEEIDAVANPAPAVSSEEALRRYRDAQMGVA